MNMIMTSYNCEPTTSQKAALLWLRNRNGDGIFDQHGVLLAAGERAPVMRSTWNRLTAAGLVEAYSGKRLRVTEAGLALDLRHITESQATWEDA